MQDFEDTQPTIYEGEEPAQKSVIDMILELANILDEQPIETFKDRWMILHPKAYRTIRKWVEGWKAWKKRRGIRGRKLAMWRRPRGI